MPTRRVVPVVWDVQQNLPLLPFLLAIVPLSLLWASTKIQVDLSRIEQDRLMPFNLCSYFLVMVVPRLKRCVASLSLFDSPFIDIRLPFQGRL